MARGRRRAPVVGVVLAVVVAALLVAFFVGDRYAERRVEREAATRLQAELGTPDPPAVDVQGWPFLVRAGARSFPQVHVVADDLGLAGGTTLPVQHADLVLTDVTTDDWYRTLRAGHAEGTARLDYRTLSDVAGSPLTAAGGGRVQLERSTSLLGTGVTATVTGTPQLDVGAQTLTLADPQIRVGSVEIPAVTADALLSTLVRPVPLRDLPLGLSVTSVTAGDDAVDVGLVGDDVELTR